MIALLLTQALNDADLAARIEVDINPRARRVSLRVDPIKGCVVLVRPPRMSERLVLSFVASRKDWIAKHLSELEPLIPLSDGSVVPYRGVDYIIRTRDGRGAVALEDGTIRVAGKPEHIARRLRDWLKAEARRMITPRALALAEQLGAKVTHVSVRDTRSRWGSATRGGRLSFSWRLILAPDDVLAYVVAHEVAHLRHMDHSPAFWRTVEMLFGSDISLAREWLRRRGATLHRYT